MNPSLLIRNTWAKTAHLPAGKKLFSKALGFIIPYSGTINPLILELRSGYARVQLKDHKKVRNHLSSIHAIALANLGELTSGLALHFDLPANSRAIVKNLSIDYLKKARGTLTAECHCEPPKSVVKQELKVKTRIYNAENELLSIVETNWLYGPSVKK